MLLDILTAAVLGVVGLRLATIATRAARSRPLRDRTVVIVKGWRPRHFLLALPVLVAVGTVAYALVVYVPGLDWGWWWALGGSGNVLTGATDRDPDNLVLQLVPLVFVLVLFPLLPLLAEREERMFRVGAERWPIAKRIRRAVEFGLVHLIMGIPVGVALALAVGGGYFTWAYLRGFRRGGDREAGLLEAARAHAAYNTTALSLALLGIALTLFTR